MPVTSACTRAICRGYRADGLGDEVADDNSYDMECVDVTHRVHSARRFWQTDPARPFARPKMAMRVDYRFQVIVSGKFEAGCKELCDAFAGKPVTGRK